MTKTPIFNVAPYEIIRCDALIELQTDSITYKDGKDEKGKPTGKGKTITSPVRPDIYINTDDERELFICRKPEDLNHTTSYNMTVNAPKVVAIYDKKKNYCPKYNVSFYMEVPVFGKLITVFAPLVFVAALSVLNIFNDGTGEGPNLENSIALCLTVVFVLPGLQVQGRGTTHSSKFDYLLNNNMIILFLFVGLTLTSVRLPSFFDEAGAIEDAGRYIPFRDWFRNNSAEEYAVAGKFGAAEFCGMLGSFFFVLAFLIPIANYVRYRNFRKNIIDSGYVLVGKNGEDISARNKDVVKGNSRPLKASDKRLAFGKDTSFDQWELNDVDSINAAKEASKAASGAASVEDKKPVRSISEAKPKKKGKLPKWPPSEKDKETMSSNLKKMHPVCDVHKKLTTKEETTTSATNGNISYAPSVDAENVAHVSRSRYWKIPDEKFILDDHGKKKWNEEEKRYETKDVELHCGVRDNY